MFFVYELASGELVFTADAEAIQYLDADRYGFKEITDAQPDWQTTHGWNPHARTLEPLSGEVA